MPIMMHQDGVTQVGEDLTVEFTDNGTIAIVTSSDASRAKVDLWKQTILDLVTTWSDKKPYLAAYDISKSALTPYTRAKSLELGDEILELRGEDWAGGYALIISNNVIGHILKRFAKRDLKARYPMWTVEVFTNRNTAIEWLRSIRPEMNKKIEEQSSNQADE